MVNGAVFFDYDGTLVDEREAIYIPTEKTKEAIRQLQKKGYLCILATGRAFNYIPEQAGELGLDGYICANGADVWVHHESIYEDVFDVRDVCELMENMDQEHINYFLECHEKCYVKDKDEHYFQTFVDTFQLLDHAFECLHTHEHILHEVEKITIIPNDPSVTKRWLERLENDYDCCRHRHETSFDIGKKYLHKGIGVQKMIEYFSIPYEHTYAFGDGSNDIGLLKHVCHGIAMKHHAKELDEYMEMVTTSVKEDGIYHALKKLEVIA